jgi:hypothetical protein
MQRRTVGWMGWVLGLWLAPAWVFAQPADPSRLRAFVARGDHVRLWERCREAEALSQPLPDLCTALPRGQVRAADLAVPARPPPPPHPPGVRDVPRAPEAAAPRVSLTSAAVPQVAIADVLLQGLAQFLAARATAELQSTVVERLRRELCPDLAAMCTFRDDGWETLRDSLRDGCAHACDGATTDAINACWQERRAAGCFFDRSCDQVQGCAGLPGVGTPTGCGACLQREATAALQAKGGQCLRAVASHALASRTCAILARDVSFAPSFGNAFRAALVEDIVALPTSALTALEAPLGVPLRRGDDERLAQVFALQALREVTRARSADEVGRALLLLVRQWQCVERPNGTACATQQDALTCGLEVFLLGAEQARHEHASGRDDARWETFLGDLLRLALQSSACVRAFPQDAHAAVRDELLAPLVRSFAAASRDFGCLAGDAQRLTGASNDRAPAITAPPPAAPPTAAAEQSAQVLARDLVALVNLAIRAGSPDPDRPSFTLPEGIPELVGAVAARDIPAALSRGLRVVAQVLDRVPSMTGDAGLRVPTTVIRTLSFGADLAAARTPDDAAAAFEAFAAPVGSWRGKGVRRMFSLTGMVGGGGGVDYTFSRGAIPTSWDGVGSVTGMVGVDVTFPLAASNPLRRALGMTYWGAFVSVLDVGSLVAQSASTPNAGAAPTQATLNPLQFVTPGLFLHASLADTPLNLMVGAQFLPAARTLEYTDAAGTARTVDVSAVRLMGSLSVDLTILPF